ncbi:hypothetical protein GJ496_003627 [Pomphorhynchus laevis]|nr:hypothetical protein GJ496_003627 [Pomphorhynchus laevis]
MNVSNAIIFINNYEQAVMRSLNPKLLFYGRYIDDSFIIASDDKSLETTIESLNKAGPLKFTCSRGKSVNFLDVVVHATANRRIEKKVCISTYCNIYIQSYPVDPGMNLS